MATLCGALIANVARGELISWWDFELGGGEDLYGNNYGMVIGSPDSITGRTNTGKSLRFNGFDSIVVDSEAAFDITEQITVTAWIYVSRFNAEWQCIVGKGDSSWRLHRNQNTGVLRFDCNGLRAEAQGLASVIGRTRVDDDQWHHVAAVYNGMELVLYVDGKLDNLIRASGKISTNNLPVSIGANSERAGREFDGMIDDVAIFDHALGPQQITELYRKGVSLFVPEVRRPDLATEVRQRVGGVDPVKGLAIIGQVETDFEHRVTMPNVSGDFSDETMPAEVYFLKARLLEQQGHDRQVVLRAYRRSVRGVVSRCPHVPIAMLWLSANLSASDFQAVVKDWMRSSTAVSANMYDIVRAFVSQGNWSLFESFLDAVFQSVDVRGQRGSCYARTISIALEEQDAWTVQFNEYCWSRPDLTGYVFRTEETTARKAAAAEDFEKAAQIYEDIAERCGPNQRKPGYELATCEQLFKAEDYEAAIDKACAFIKAHRGTQGMLVKQAMMIQGQAHIQLAAMESAMDSFFAIMAEFPDSGEAVEGNYFLGYCELLQGKFAEAADTFSILVKEHPTSMYADKARLYLDRIKEFLPSTTGTAISDAR